MLETITRRFDRQDDPFLRLVLLLHLQMSAKVSQAIRSNGGVRQAIEVLAPERKEVDHLCRLLDRELAAMERWQTRAISPGHPEWPAVLDTAWDPPPLLYLRGRLPDFQKVPGLALVGSRIPTEYGLRITRALAGIWTEMGGCVVSGGAKGIDSSAHLACMEKKGTTLCVFGTGIARPYPAGNRTLFQRIFDQGGGLISELPMCGPVRGFSFPRRNRIIAGLAEVVVVTQAGEKSGALHTATFALKSARLLFTVPAPIDEEAYRGGLKLLEQGVPALTSAERLAHSFACAGRVAPPKQLSLALEPKRKAVSVSKLDNKSRLALELLEQGPVHLDDLGESLGLEQGQLALLLMDMETAGWIEKSAGNRYICVVRVER
jgi:DNA processing protein